MLATEYGFSGPMAFETRVGQLRVARDGDLYRLDIPRLNPEALDVLPSALDGVFAQPPVAVFRNFENIFADLGSEAAVRAFIPDYARIGGLGHVGLVITGQGNGVSGAAFVSRYFAPGAGIPEDPVTGSIHATLVPYWSNVLGGIRHQAFQASSRGGWLDCELTEDRVLLRGQAVTFMNAAIRLPF